MKKNLLKFYASVEKFLQRERIAALEKSIKRVKNSGTGLSIKKVKTLHNIKRYFSRSIMLLVNPFTKFMQNGNILTTKTVYNIYKTNLKKSNSGMKWFFHDKDIASVKLLQHYCQINGIKFYKENYLDVNAFSTLTNGDFHKIALDQKELNDVEVLELKELVIPTMKVNLTISSEGKNLVFPYKSLVKFYLSDDSFVKVKNEDIKEIPLNKAIEITSNQEKIMEMLGFKGFEFIEKKNQVYLVSKKDIIKQGEIIVNINFENAKKVTVKDAVKIGEKIATNSELANYINVSPKLKETFLKNSYDYFKQNDKFLKDD